MNDTNFLISNGIDVNKSLELFGDIETYNDTIGEFLISANEKLNKLETYKDAKDMGNYAIYAHSLKSDAKYFGLVRLAELAFDHEQKSKAGDVYYIYDNYNELKTEVEKMLEIIKKYLQPETIIEEEKTPAKTTGTVYNNRTILVVDDSNIIRNFVERIFNENYEVGTAKDGQEAIDIITANKDNENIAAILLDLNMPNVDGFAVLEFMKENGLFTVFPVSIISGDSSKETIEKAFRYQIVDMLGKPFNEVDVKRVVEKTIYFKEQL